MMTDAECLTCIFGEPGKLFCKGFGLEIADRDGNCCSYRHRDDAVRTLASQQQAKLELLQIQAEVMTG